MSAPPCQYRMGVAWAYAPSDIRMLFIHLSTYSHPALTNMEKTVGRLAGWPAVDQSAVRCWTCGGWIHVFDGRPMEERP